MSIFDNLFGKHGAHYGNHHDHHDRHREDPHKHWQTPSPCDNSRPMNNMEVFCASCRAPNPNGSKFCSQCGKSTLPSPCSQCSVVLPVGARFCSQCGKQAT